MTAYRDELAAAKEQNERLRQRLRAREGGTGKHGIGLRLQWIPPAMLGLLGGCLLVVMSDCRPTAYERATTPVLGRDGVEDQSLGMIRTSAAMSGDAVFFGQYWLAEVEAAGDSNVALGDACIVTLREGAFNGAGLVTIHCGQEKIFSGIVSPPERARGDGGPCAYHDDGHLNCSPYLLDAEEGSRSHPRMCWLDTASGRASCPGGVELRFRSSVRDPRIRQVPTWARELEMPAGPRAAQRRRAATI